MNNSNQQSQEAQPTENHGDAQQPTPPHDVGGIYYSTRIKIHDPNSGEVLVQIRGDA
jgi:hypothetical protein